MTARSGKHFFCRTICYLFLLFLPALASAQPPATTPVILVLGDSLSAGYGIDVKKGWVALLEEQLQSSGFDYQVVNASVSGETSGGGLARLPALLQTHSPAIVIVELGGNDGLRGHPVNGMRKQLASIIEKSEASSANVLLLGMRIPPNYGKRYTDQFHNAFSDLAKEYRLAYVPFFLENVAINASLMQRDGVHPTAEAQAAMLESVWPTLEKMLK